MFKYFMKGYVSEKKSHTSVRQCCLLGNRIGSGKEVCLGSYDVGHIISRQRYHLFFFLRIRIFSLKSWSMGCETSLAENTEIYSNEQH